jgi:glutamate racemase
MTVRSGVYPATLRRLAPHVRVAVAQCSGIVEYIEAGNFDHPALRQRVATALSPVAGQVDTLILGCTHFPLVRKVVRNAVGPEVALVDGADELLRDVDGVLGGMGAVSTSPPRPPIIWTSGRPDLAARVAAAAALGPVDIRVAPLH